MWKLQHCRRRKLTHISSHLDHTAMQPVPDQQTAYTFSTVQLLVSPIYTTPPQEYEGQRTAKTNIHLEHLLGGALQRAPQNCLTLGLVMELHRLRNRKKLNVATLTGWINTVFGLDLHSDFVYPKVKDIHRTIHRLAYFALYMYFKSANKIQGHSRPFQGLNFRIQGLFEWAQINLLTGTLNVLINIFASAELNWLPAGDSAVVEIN